MRIDARKQMNMTAMIEVERNCSSTKVRSRGIDSHYVVKSYSELVLGVRVDQCREVSG
jgi:hypothetical protein